MGLANVKGAILEELVLHLLAMIGYRTIEPGEEGTRQGKSGLEIQGRGEWHQIDAFAAFDYTPAFMYPMRLLLEAKCYADSSPIGIEVVRNAVGVLKDITENYFTFSTNTVSDEPLKLQRFNYQSAIFSTSGYTSGAQRYAIAHQIFLIQYDGVSLFQTISQGLQKLSNEHFKEGVLNHKGAQNEVRQHVRRLLKNSEIAEDNVFKDEGREFFIENVISPLFGIGGSYFGMLQGKWPMHLLSKRPLPANLFFERDMLKCRVTSRNGTTWSFTPLSENENSPNWFSLEFDMPVEIAELVKAVKGDKAEIAHVKRRHFSFINVSGQIGKVRRQIRLEMDEDWLDRYILSKSTRNQKGR